MIIIASLGGWLILYSLIRQFTSFGFSEEIERNMINGVMIIAVGLFLYNRKRVSDARKAKEAEEEAQRRAEENPEEEVFEGDENLPHWERNKKNTGSEDDSD